MKRLLQLTVVFCWFFLMMEQVAFAYLDPGTGSLFLQLLLGGVAGLAVIGKLYWGRLLLFLGVSQPEYSIDEAQGQQLEPGKLKEQSGDLE